ncbi:MAG: hypothetical protein K2O85_02260 [Helicobacter sp.]|nr:hypothetical protein [Helicobacter sp.]
MKLIWKIILAIVLLLMVIIVIPFTPPGNALLKPYLQSTLNAYSPLPLEIERFELGFSSFGLDIKGEESVTATLNGTYSLFSLSLDSYLNLNVKDLSYASKIAGVELEGAFVADVRAHGNLFGTIEVVGESDIAESKTIFLAVLQNLGFSSLDLQIENAKIQSLLALVAKPPYAQGLLNVNAKITQNDTQGLSGDANLKILSGKVNAALVKKDFGASIPATQFTTNLLAHFSGENVTHDLKIHSNLGDITTDGTTNINTFATDSKYAAALSDLAPLTPLIQMPIRGDLQISGTIKGDQKSLLVDGQTNLAQSKTTYRASLVDFAPANVDIDLQALNLERLLYMLHQPIYTQGALTLTAKLNDFNDGISGQVALDIPNGKLMNAAMKQSFDLDMPTTNYTLSAASTLHRGTGELLASFKSALANLIIDKANFTLQPTITFKSPYQLGLPDLSKLQFVSGMPLQGKIDSHGDVSFDSAGLIATFVSNTLGGNINATLNNNLFKANLSQLRSEEVLRMLTYQPFFLSEVNGALEYELISKQGILDAKLNNGRLAESTLTKIVLPLLKVDLTREAYEEASLKTRINDKILNNDINFVSHNTSIVAKELKLDTAAQKIDGVLTLSIKEKPTNITISGNLNSPKISIDAVNRAIDKAKEKAGEKIEQAIDKGLQKLKPEQSEGVKNLLQNILQKP